MRTLKIYVPVAISMGSIISLSYVIIGGTHPEFQLITRFLGINVYWERIRDAIVVYFRILPMIFTMVFFLSTSRERDVIVAMRTIRLPFVVTYVFAMALRAAGMVLEDFQIVRQAEQARGFDSAGKSIAYKLKKYVMYMIPLFALSLRRSEEFTNALVARGYSFTSKIKRADYVLTHYSYKYYDAIFTALISLTFIVILFTYVCHYRTQGLFLEISQHPAACPGYHQPADRRRHVRWHHWAQWIGQDDPGLLDEWTHPRSI
jgi:energy-coupling factor transporter transmembrane protein EcfT